MIITDYIIKDYSDVTKRFMKIENKKMEEDTNLLRTYYKFKECP